MFLCNIFFLILQQLNSIRNIKMFKEVNKTVLLIQNEKKTHNM